VDRFSFFEAASLFLASYRFNLLEARPIGDEDKDSITSPVEGGREVMFFPPLCILL